MSRAEIATPPVEPITWHVWVKDKPSLFAEVTERFWLDARVKGACEISARIHQPVFFDQLEATPVGSGLVNIEIERARRGLIASPPSIR